MDGGNKHVVSVIHERVLKEKYRRKKKYQEEGNQDYDCMRLFLLTFTNCMSIALPCGWEKPNDRMASNGERDGLDLKKEKSRKDRLPSTESPIGSRHEQVRYEVLHTGFSSRIRSQSVAGTLDIRPGTLVGHRSHQKYRLSKR